MKRFESWDEVKEYLKDEDDEWTTVNYHSWIYNKNSMVCGEPGCCEDNFESLEDCIYEIKRASGNDVSKVTSYD